MTGGEGLETGEVEEQAEDYEDFETDLGLQLLEDSRELPRGLTHKA